MHLEQQLSAGYGTTATYPYLVAPKSTKEEEKKRWLLIL
jgi:hypothetical protein